MAIVPTPETGKQITDYTAGTFDGNSLIYQSRNGQGYKISGDDIGTYTVGQQVHSGLGNKTVKQYVDSEISALPEPMIFKGTLGTGGTIQTLPTATSANEGFTYKVITDGTYAGQTAKVGDVFTSDGSTWVLVPAGDDVEDTWRNVKVNGTEILGSAISTGALDLKAGTNISLSNNGGEVTINNDLTIDDTTTANNKLWSSNKINTEISAVSSVCLTGGVNTISDTPVASFTIGSELATALPVMDLKAKIEAAQSGSGTPSPTNIRPISGWTGVNISRCGVNLWDEKWENGAFDTTTGANITLATQIRSKNLLYVSPNTSYYCKKGGSGAIYCIFYDKNNNVITGYATGNSKSANASEISNTVFTTPPTCVKMKFYCTISYGATYNNDISINYLSTDTDYHAYNGSVYPIDWTTEAGTVYGGTLNVTTGELTIDKEIVDLGDLTWTYRSAQVMFTGAFTGYVRPTNNTEIPSILCSSFLPTNLNTLLESTTTNKVITLGRPNNWDGSILIRDTDYTDAELFKNAIDGAKLVYPLTTPQTIQLTPTQVNTILGENNIFADTGDVSVKYANINIGIQGG